MTITGALEHVRELKRRLDAPPDLADAELGPDPDLVRFVRVHATITPGAASTGVAPEPVDEIITGSRLLERLRSKAPELDADAVGSRQCWIAVGERHAELAAAAFVPSRAATAVRPQTKPFGLGLYSSSATLGTPGMWWCYLRVHEGSTLFPRPWRVWSFGVAPSARVAEIRSARDWVTLIESAPFDSSGTIYPDWSALAEHWDGVHVTPSAVAAIQGMRFQIDDGTTAPAYWDVESTLWLRWVTRDLSDQRL
jgi:hypothetical protein